MPNEVFQWKDEYTVGVEEIDIQHKKFVETVAKLHSAIKNRKVQEELNTIYEELVDYATNHFATEEKYFEKCAYEHTKEHVAEHRAFTVRLAMLKKKASYDNIDASFELIDFLEDWWITHLEGADRKYVDCLKKCGL